jgi:hypothetical protein
VDVRRSFSRPTRHHKIHSQNRMLQELPFLLSLNQTASICRSNVRGLFRARQTRRLASHFKTSRFQRVPHKRRGGCHPVLVGVRGLEQLHGRCPPEQSPMDQGSPSSSEIKRISPCASRVRICAMTPLMASSPSFSLTGPRSAISSRNVSAIRCEIFSST